MSDPEDELRALRLAEAALDVPRAQRRAWLTARASPRVASRARALAEAADELPEDPQLSLGFRLDAPSADRSGEQIAGYTLERVLGEGGSGQVYLARAPDGALVALKLMREGPPDDRADAQLERERRLLEQVNHPNIARLVDGGRTDDGRPFLVTEYVDGVPLDVHARQLGLEARLRLFVSVCAAVMRAHRARVIHRDIKPSNVLVTRAGQPKLLDFGIGKALDAAAADPRTVGMLHTPPYASPEQLRGEPLTASTDVYSLGVVLYELITGTLPFSPRGRGPVAFAREVASAAAEAPSARAGIPAVLDPIALRALGKTPSERFPDVEALVHALRAVLTRG